MSFGLSVKTKEGKVSYFSNAKAYRLFYEYRISGLSGFTNGLVTTIDVILPGLDTIDNKFALVENSRIAYNTSGNLVITGTASGYCCSKNSYTFLGSDTIRCFFSTYADTLGSKFIYIFGL